MAFRRRYGSHQLLPYVCTVILLNDLAEPIEAVLNVSVFAANGIAPIHSLNHRSLTQNPPAEVYQTAARRLPQKELDGFSSIASR